MHKVKAMRAMGGLTCSETARTMMLVLRAKTQRWLPNMRSEHSQNSAPRHNGSLGERLSKAARSFANDYGPLSAANSGEEAALYTMGGKLLEALNAHGLQVTPSTEI